MHSSTDMIEDMSSTLQPGPQADQTQEFLHLLVLGSLHEAATFAQVDGAADFAREEVLGRFGINQGRLLRDAAGHMQGSEDDGDTSGQEECMELQKPCPRPSRRGHR